MWFGGETENGCCEQKESLVTEKGTRVRERNTQAVPQREYFPKAIAWESKRG